MFDKLHFYPKYFVFFTAILLLFALPAFADSTKQKTKNTSQNQNSEVKLNKFDATVAYNIWNEYYLAQEQGINFPLPVFKPNADPETLKQLLAMWNEGKQKAYKESVRRFQKKSKANQLPQETSSNQNSNTKALTKFDVNVAYKIWNDYYLTQEQGINPYPPKFEPLNTNEREAKKLIAIWNKGKQKAEKEALKRREDARTGKTSFQAQAVTSLPDSNQIPVAQTNNPYLNRTNHLQHFSKPTTIAGVFSQTTNSAYTDSVKLLNNNNSIALNNNKALAQLNAQNISYNVAKAKELANIAYPLVDNPGVTTQYLIDPNNITGLPQVVEELQNGQVIRQYTYGADGIISMRQRINNEWVVSFFIKDGHGSVRMLTDVNGNITDTYDYDAFGNLVAKTGNTPNSRLYAGEEFDEDLGFYYLRARFLDTVKGRFLTQDNFEGNFEEPTSLHKYLYANTDPINKIDPTGKNSINISTSINIANTLSSISTLNLSIPFLQERLPLIKGKDNDVVEKALREATTRATVISECDKTFDNEKPNLKIPSLKDLVTQYIINKNLFDGRTSIATIIVKKNNKDQEISIADYFKLNTAGALVLGQRTTFLGRYFFSPEIPTTQLEQRALILLHESVHNFGKKSDTDFDKDKSAGSKKISRKIIDGCFRSLKTAGLSLGNVD